MCTFRHTALSFVSLLVWCIPCVAALAQSFPPVLQLMESGARLGENPAGEVIGVHFPKPDTTNDDLRPVSSLSQLEWVELRRTSVTDEGLVHLQTLEHLKALFLPPTITDQGIALLRGHQGVECLEVTGRGITDAGAAYLPDFPRIRSLSLKRTAITDAGMEYVAKCATLEALGTPEGIHDEGLRQVRLLKQLVSLDLNGARVTNRGLAHVAALRRLEWLGLGGTEISDEGLLHLEELTELAFLDLTGTNVGDGGMVHLRRLSKLESLYLPNGVSDIGMRDVAKLAALRVLRASNAKITDAGLSVLPGNMDLRILSLYDTAITNAGVPHLARLTTLEELNLGRTKVTREGFDRLRQALPNTRIQWPQ